MKKSGTEESTYVQWIFAENDTAEPLIFSSRSLWLTDTCSVKAWIFEEGVYWKWSCLWTRQTDTNPSTRVPTSPYKSKSHFHSSPTTKALELQTFNHIGAYPYLSKLNSPTTSGLSQSKHLFLSYLQHLMIKTKSTISMIVTESE